MRPQKPFWFILAVLVITGTISIFIDEKMISRIFFFCLFFILICFIWTFFSVRGLQVRRFTRSHQLQVGMKFEERFEISNQIRFVRLWLEVIDQSDLPHSHGSNVLTFLGGREERSYVRSTLLNRRGEFSLGPTILRSGDPFGLFISSRTFHPINSLIVLPYQVDVRKFPSPPGQLSGGKALRSATTEITPYASGVREYRPGDSLSRIHWKTTARRDRLMVKEFDQDPQATVWMFLDASKSARVTGLKHDLDHDLDRHQLELDKENPLLADSFEYAVSAAASITGYYIRQNRAIGLVTFDQALTVITPERGERQMGKILETLSFIQAEGRIPLLGVVENQAANISKGSSAILITSDVSESLEISVDLFIRRGIRSVAIVVDPVSFGKPGNPKEKDIYANLKSRGVPVRQMGWRKRVLESLEEG
jgi:uncharacterized protein (DUF58 family)